MPSRVSGLHRFAYAVLYLAVACPWASGQERGSIVAQGSDAIEPDPAPQGPAGLLAPAAPPLETIDQIFFKIQAFQAIKAESVAGEPPVAPERFIGVAGQQAPPPPATPIRLLEPDGAPGPVPSAPEPPPLTFLRAHVLQPSEGGFAAQWCEPSVTARRNPATNADQILLTFNTLAAFSDNGGQSFQPLNPTARFSPSQPNNFHGDQIALYDPGHKMMLWLLQEHQPGFQPSLRLRLAVANEQDLAAQVWPQPYQFTPANFPGAAPGDWFDFPDIALTKRFLYLSCNVFPPPGVAANRGSLLIRFELEPMVKHAQIKFDAMKLAVIGNVRPAQNAHNDDTMHFVAHQGDGRNVRIYTWKDSEAVPTLQTAAVDPWIGGQTLSRAFTPTGNWLNFSDSRITAAWVEKGKDRLGFAWSAAQDSDQGGQFVLPHVRVVMLRLSDFTNRVEARLSRPNVAIAYPSITPSADGSGVGVAVLFGGSQFPNFPGPNPGFAVGTMQEAGGSATFDLTQVAQGQTAITRSGDYVTIRPHPDVPDSWVAAGYVPIPLSGTAGGSLVHYVHFRRTQPAPQIAALAPPQPAVPNAAAEAITKLSTQVTEQIDKLGGQLSEVRREVERLRAEIRKGPDKDPDKP